MFFNRDTKIKEVSTQINQIAKNTNTEEATANLVALWNKRLTQDNQEYDPIFLALVNLRRDEHDLVNESALILWLNGQGLEEDTINELLDKYPRPAEGRFSHFRKIHAIALQLRARMRDGGPEKNFAQFMMFVEQNILTNVKSGEELEHVLRVLKKPDIANTTEGSLILWLDAKGYEDYTVAQLLERYKIS